LVGSTKDRKSCATAKCAQILLSIDYALRSPTLILNFLNALNGFYGKRLFSVDTITRTWWALAPIIKLR